MSRVLAVVLLLAVLLAACEAEDTNVQEPGNAAVSSAATATVVQPDPPDNDPTTTEEPTEPAFVAQEPVATNTPESTATLAPTATRESPPTETPVPPPTDTPDPMADMSLVTVTNIVDGDTIDVLIDGQEQRIRIIGVDTPETKDPNQPVMCFGAEATAFTSDMIGRAGHQVYLGT